MLEGVLTGLLNKYLVDFIEGLDAEQLKLGVWRGEINLSDLRVKPSALDFLHLPVGIRSGSVGRFKLIINWRHLWTQPIQITLEDLYVVVCNKDMSRINEAAEAERALAAKIASLKSIEDYVLSEAFQDALQGIVKKPSKSGFVGQLITSIIDNIQVEVKRIHFRFEHDAETPPPANPYPAAANVAAATTAVSSSNNSPTPLSSPSDPSTLGLLLHRLSVTSTDEHGNERFANGTTLPHTEATKLQTYKKVDLEGLAIYFNTGRTSATARLTTKEQMAAFFTSTAAPSSPFTSDSADSSPFASEAPKVDYLLKPLHGAVRVQLLKSDPTADSPSATCAQVKLQALDLSLDEAQYHSLLLALASISKASAADRIILQKYMDAFRPGTAADRKKYAALYKRTLMPNWEPNLDEEEKKQLQQLDKELSPEDLHLWRAWIIVVHSSQVPTRSLRKRGDFVAPPTGFVSKVMSGAVNMAKSVVGMGGAPETLLLGPDEQVTVDQEEKMLLDMIENGTDYSKPPPMPQVPAASTSTSSSSASTAEPDVPLPPSYVSLSLEYEQTSLNFSLLTRSRRPLTTVSIIQPKVNFGMRKQGMKAQVSLANVTVSDFVTPNTLYPEIFGMSKHQREKLSAVAAASTSPSSSPDVTVATGAGAPFIDVLYETAPLDQQVDTVINLSILPSLLVVHNKFISRVTAFFAPPPPSAAESAANHQAQQQQKHAVEWGAAHLASLRKATTINIQDSLKSHSSMKISVALATPTILVTAAPNILHSPVLVLDLGVLSVESKPQSKATLTSLRETIMVNTAARDAKIRLEEITKKGSSSLSSLTTPQKSRSSSSSSVPPSSPFHPMHTPLLGQQELRQCYDDMDIRINDVKLFFSQSQSSIGGRGFDSKVESDILSPVSIQTVVQMSIAPEVGWIPSMRITGEIPELELELSTTNFHKLMAIANSFSAPSPSAASIAPITVTSAIEPPRLRTPELSVNTETREGGDSEYESGAEEDEFPRPQQPTIESKEFLTLQDLTEMFQSEKEAKAILAELDEDGNNEVSRDEYDRWYANKKHILKHRLGMEMEFRIGRIVITIVDDKRNASGAGRSTLNLPSTSSSAPSTPSKSGSTFSFAPFRQILSIRLVDLQFQQKAKTFDGEMTVDIGSLVVEDHVTQFPGDFKHILSTTTPQSTPSKLALKGSINRFLHVVMKTNSKEHPDFETENKIQSDILVEMGTIILLIDPHSIDTIVCFLLKEFMPPAEGMEAKQPVKSAGQAAPNPPPPYIPPPSAADETPSAGDAPVVTMRISCSLNLFHLLLTNRGRYVTKLATQGLKVALDMHSVGGMFAQVEMNKLAVVDMRGLKPIPIIIGLESLTPNHPQPCLQVAYTMFNPAGALAFGFNAHVEVQLQSVKIVQDFYFVGACLNYLWMTLALPFIAGDKPAAVAAAPAPIESQALVVDGEEDHKSNGEPEFPLPFIKWSVALDDIEIVFPNHKTQDPTHKLTLHFRHLSVTNNVLVMNDARGIAKQYVQHAVGIGGMTMLSSYFPGPEQHSRSATVMQLHQMAVITNMMQDINSSLDVRIEASRVDITLAKENYANLMEMLWAILDNLQGLWAPPADQSPAPAAQPQPKVDKPAPASAPSASPSAPSSWIKVHVLFHDLHIQLLNNKGWNESDNLLSLLGRKMDVRYTQENLGTGGMNMGVETAWKAFEIVDESKCTPPARGSPIPILLPELRRMMGIKDPTSKPTKQLYKNAHASSRARMLPVDLSRIVKAHLEPTAPPSGSFYVKWFQRAVTGAMDIEVDFQYFYYSITSMVVMEMATFFYIPPKEADVAAAAKLAEEAAAKQKEQQLVANATTDVTRAKMGDAIVSGMLVPYTEPVAAGLQLQVKLRMPHAVVQLLAATSSPQPRSLLVAFDLSVGFGMGLGCMSASVQLDALKAFESINPISQGGFDLIRTAESSGQEYIIHPTCIHVAFLSEPSKLFPGNNTMHVDVGLETLRINMGYQHYLLLMGALEVMYPPSPPPAPIESPKHVRATSMESVQSNVSSPRAIEPSPALSASPPAAASEVSPPPPVFPNIPGALHFSESNIHVQVAGIQLNIINDCYSSSMYLFRMQMTKLLTKIHKFGDSGGIYARLDLSADFHNHRVQCWEPLLENWDIIFTQHSSCNTATPQEFLFLNQPKRAPTNASETSGTVGVDTSFMGSNTNMLVPSSPTGVSSASRKVLSPEEVSNALTPFTDLSITSSKEFNLCLSVAAIQDLVDFLALIKDAPLKSHPDTRFYFLPPYRIENHTNLEVEIYITADKGQRAKSSIYLGRQTESEAANALANNVKKSRSGSAIQALRSASVAALNAVGIDHSDSEDEDANKTAEERAAEQERKDNVDANSRARDAASDMSMKQLMETPIIIPPYSERDIVFPDRMNVSERAITVKFVPAALGFMPFTLNISKNGSHKIMVTPQTSDGDETVVVTDISVSKNVRVISLHSNVCIGNQTEGELAIRTTTTTEHVIGRGKFFWLPVLPTNTKRLIKVRPYDALEEEQDGSMIGSERIIASTEVSDRTMKAESQAAKDVVDGVDSVARANSRSKSPHSVESRVLHSWSGEITCNSKEHKEKRSEITGAMHYRCVNPKRETRKARSEYQTARLFHQQSFSAAGLAAQRRNARARGTLASTPRKMFVQTISDADTESESTPYNFTVYAAVWKKREVKRHENEEIEKDHKKKPDGTTSAAPAEEAAELVASDSAYVPSGPLGKKKHCSIYYVRNPLTIENFLASSVQLRLYNSTREIDEDFQLIQSNEGNNTVSPVHNCGNKSPPGTMITPAPPTSSANPNPSTAASGSGASGKAANLMNKVSRLAHIPSLGEQKVEPPTLIEEIVLERGQSFPSHAVSTHLDTFISLRLPQLNCEWTEPVQVRLSREPRTVKFKLQDKGDANGDNIGGLTILGEISVVQGHVHVILFTHYWIYDLTKLGLMLINDETKQPLPRLNAAAAQTDISPIDVKEQKLIKSTSPRNASASPDTHPFSVGADNTKAKKGSKGGAGRKAPPLLNEDSSPSTSAFNTPSLTGNNTPEGLHIDSELDALPDSSIQMSRVPTVETVMDHSHIDPDLFMPVMFSSQQRTKKQRIRIRAGVVASDAVVQQGDKEAHVSSAMLGPLNDPCTTGPVSMSMGTNQMIRWSDYSTPAGMEHVGTTESLRFMQNVENKDGTGGGKCFEVICNVAAGPGRFYRTKQVSFAPRFVIVNKLANTGISIRQYHPGAKAGQSYDPSSSIASVEAGETQIFHWPHAVKNDRTWICVKRSAASYLGWNWSGFIDITQAGEFPMVVTHSKAHQTWFARFEVRVNAYGTAFVIIDEFPEQSNIENLAQQLPYLIQNRSDTQTIRFKQVRDKVELCSAYQVPVSSTSLKSDVKHMLSTGSIAAMTSSSNSLISSATLPDTPFDWFEVPPHGIMPYIWEEPMQGHSVLVQFNVVSSATNRIVDWHKEKKVELDDADAEGSATMRYRADNRQETRPPQKIFYFHESAGPTQLLVFSDKPRKGRRRLLGLARGSDDDSGDEKEEKKIDGNDSDLKEIPDDGNKISARLAGLFKKKDKKSKDKKETDKKIEGGRLEPLAEDEDKVVEVADVNVDAAGENNAEDDDNLTTFDPDNQTADDKRVQRELEEKVGEYEGMDRKEQLIMKKLPPPMHSSENSPQASLPSNTNTTSLPSSDCAKKSLVPDSFLESGVLHLTVISARGFKSSRKRMFAGVVYNNIMHRTEVLSGPTREPRWNKRMLFRSAIDSEEFNPKSCWCFSSAVQGAKIKKEKQTLFVNIYEKTRFSEHFLGCATIDLRTIGFEHTDGWFDVRKMKGGKRGLEKRGEVHLGLWWQQEGEDALQHQIEEDVPEVERDDQKRLEDEEIGAGGKSSIDHTAANALAIQSDADSSAISGPPRLHRIISNPTHLAHVRDLMRLTDPSAYAVCDTSNDSVWSMFRVRIITTALMKELAQSHQLDFLQGRLVAYVTCPLMPRAFTVLLMDHGSHNMVKKWRQDIHFAVPHFLAKRYRKDAFVRITLFFYKSRNYLYGRHQAGDSDIKVALPATSSVSSLPVSAPLAKVPSPAAANRGLVTASSGKIRHLGVSSPSSNELASVSSPSPLSNSPSPQPKVKHERPWTPISGNASDLFSDPIRIGECLFDLMSVREVNEDGAGQDGNEEKQAMDDEAKERANEAKAEAMAEEEEERAARAGSSSNLNKVNGSAKKKTKKELQEEEKERQRKEWQAKWVPIVSSIRSSVFASAPSPSSLNNGFKKKDAATEGSSSDDENDNSPSTGRSVLRRPALCLNVKRHIIERDRAHPFRPTTTAIKVLFPLFGISVIDSAPEEVCYVSMSGVGCSVNDSQWQTTISATIQSFQVDNLLRQAMFPVVFNPTLIQGETIPQPFLQLAVNKKKSSTTNLLMFPYASMLIQKMDIRIEESNIWRTLTFINQIALRFSGDLSHAADLDVAALTKSFNEHVLAVPQTGTQRMYFKLLHIQPLAVNVSFVSNPAQRTANHYYYNPMYTFLHMLEAGIGNVTDAPLRLNGKLIENAVGTSDIIIWSLVKHYVQQGVMQAYKIFGSVEFLGNPVSVVNEVGSGVTNFFCEPAKGLMISPEAFGTGLAKGSGSLLKGTIGGLMGAASAVTNSASKAMATATGDDAFIASQAENKNQKQPEHIGDGVVMGIQAFGSSLFSGVTGVFLDPLKGAQQGGVLGFGKGLAKGVAGLVFKPLSGVLDLTSNTLRGIGNTAGYLLDGKMKELRPVRPRRYINPSTGIVLPYHWKESMKHDPLWKAENKEERKKAEEKLKATQLQQQPQMQQQKSSTALSVSPKK